VPLLLAGLISEFSEHGNGSSYYAQLYAVLLIVCILASVLLTHPYMMGMMVRSQCTFLVYDFNQRALNSSSTWP